MENLNQFRKGDHLRVYRERTFFGFYKTHYWHHGLYLGNGKVYHFTGEPTFPYLWNKGAVVKKDTFENFSKGGCVEVVNYNKCLPASEVIRRARAKRGFQRYNLVLNNCEHFCVWCKTGVHSSLQVVDKAISLPRMIAKLPLFLCKWTIKEALTPCIDLGLGNGLEKLLYDVETSLETFDARHIGVRGKVVIGRIKDWYRVLFKPHNDGLSTLCLLDYATKAELDSLLDHLLLDDVLTNNPTH